MPSATSEKLNQLRTQLQDCTNPKVAQVLKSAIAKLEAQLNPGQVQAKTSKAKPSNKAERKVALKESHREANRVASRQQRTTLKPPSNKEVKPKPEATSQNDKPPTPAQDIPQELTDSMAQSEKSTTQDSPREHTDAASHSKNTAPVNQPQEKVAPQQQKTAKPSEAKPKQRDRLRKKQPLLPGNGTHRAWCRIPGIIQVQEPKADEEQPQYFLEVDEHQLPLRVRPRHIKLIGTCLDKSLMVRCYPQIKDGGIVAAQFCGTNEPTPEKPEDWVLIGVWNADKQRVLVQRDRKQDSNRRILQHSPLISEDCLEQLQGGKLYRYDCRREGITVTIVGVEAMVGEEKNSNQTTP